jgi:hypothetical protein
VGSEEVAVVQLNDSKEDSLAHKASLHRDAVQLTKEYGIFTLRTCTLLNGGAILAILGLLGSLLSRSPQQPVVKLAEFVPPFCLFGFGLVTVATAAACGYFNFLQSQSGLGALTSISDPNKANVAAAYFAKRARIFMYAANVLGLISILSFAAGAIMIARVFSHY